MKMVARPPDQEIEQKEANGPVLVDQAPVQHLSQEVARLDEALRQLVEKFDQQVDVHEFQQLAETLEYKAENWELQQTMNKYDGTIVYIQELAEELRHITGNVDIANDRGEELRQELAQVTQQIKLKPDLDRFAELSDMMEQAVQKLAVDLSVKMTLR